MTELTKKCQIFTPSHIVQQMIDLAGYRTELYGKNVLENSCGDGAVLTEIVQKYIEDSIQSGIPIDSIRKGLEKDIVAYEIDRDKIEECKAKLNQTTQKYNISDIIWDIRAQNYLAESSEQKFDFIIGNPPYISYTDLPESIREWVRESFSSCRKGKFDYCYAFIEKSYRMLIPGGTLVYIIPNSIFKNVFANELRTMIGNDIDTIIDFAGDNVFQNAMVSPCIIRIRKGQNSPHVLYVHGTQKLEMSKEILDEKWNFTTVRQSKGIRVGDFYHVSSSIATLKNDVFVLDKGYMDGDYYINNNFKIERGLLRRAVSPKERRYGGEKYIIFPYYYEKDRVRHYTEEEMRKLFPYGWEYLVANRKKLEQRSLDKNTRWFEFGRSQALNRINQKKILISNVISEHTTAYPLETEDVPFAGCFIYPTGDLSIEELLRELNEKAFIEYAQTVGTSVNGKSTRVRPEDIMNYQMQMVK